MKILYVVGACLTKNTSANMSHNGFLKGLIENGADVDVLMANSSWGEEDKALPKWKEAQYYEYNAISFADKLKANYKKNEVPSKDTSAEAEKVENKKDKCFIKSILRMIIKKFFYLIFPQDPVYPLEKTWLKEATKFTSQDIYDVVISNSSPAASHKMVDILLKSKKISAKKWIQIWEDPWFFDLYGGHSANIQEEEHNLLKCAQEVYYVSPLTLMYQKKYYSDCAEKMRCVPLPFLKIESNIKKETFYEKNSFGYFGDYYSKTRNLVPFYEALKEEGYKGNIYGDSDLQLEETENVRVAGRVTLDILASIQEKTQVLVHLCNLSGGQIPGKIYHYSATNKPILFILDGTKEEQDNIRSFFSKFDRYYFCDNEKESIKKTMEQILREQRKFGAVKEFEPKEVVKHILMNI